MKKNTFSIKSIDTVATDLKYGINTLTSKKAIPRNTTKISDLQVNVEPNIISFLDEAKKPKKCIPTMLSTQGDFLPEKTSIKCFWCRHNFDSTPIGCPLRYVQSQIEKTYTSEITKDKYSIKENIGKSSFDVRDEENDCIEYKIYDKDYYETDGVFCSFNCMLTFIIENKMNPMYKNSRLLMYKLYFDIFGLYPKDLIPAPHWRLIDEYGGPLTITEYRKSFNKLEYIDMGKINYIPKFKTVERIYEEKNRF
jgi:hypothetical protein